MNDKKTLIAHLSMFGACAGWGLMAPIGKDAMTHGIDGITMVTFRVCGACLLFWLASLFAKKEMVPLRDKLMFIGAAVFGLICNQCCYTIGLSITSPINASIVTTSMPIFAMILAALILKEPITGKKALGVLMGCSGALILILTSAAHASDKVGDIRGDLLCLMAQFSFALYLSLFNPLIRRYNVFTINKYMFSWATLMLLPFTFGHVSEVLAKPIPTSTWWRHRHLHRLHTHHDRPAHPAAHGSFGLQLRATHRLRSSLAADGHRHTEAHPRLSRDSGVQRCLAGH